MAKRVDSAHISPTAHYTGYVWCKNHLSPPELATRTGRAMFYGLQGPMLGMSVATGRLTLEQMLLQRHLLIDHFLDQAIIEGRVGQVLEVAAGMSGRGYRFTSRYPELTYIEGDLPLMVERKGKALAKLPHHSADHEVVTLDALSSGDGDSENGAKHGPTSNVFEVAASWLDPDVGTAIITEGLLGYLSMDQVLAMWQRFATVLHQFPSGLYLTDQHFDDEAHEHASTKALRGILRTVTRGDVALHFKDLPEAVRELANAGFDGAAVYRPGDLINEVSLPQSNGPDLVNIACATTGG
jgi:O-methyltransferase involved in polyketide biosynthesis